MISILAKKAIFSNKNREAFCSHCEKIMYCKDNMAYGTFESNKEISLETILYLENIYLWKYSFKTAGFWNYSQGS